MWDFFHIFFDSDGIWESTGCTSLGKERGILYGADVMFARHGSNTVFATS